MQSPSVTVGRMEKIDVGWTAGMNTIRHPWLLRDDQYRRGINVVNRGGIIQTRPGNAMRLIAPKGNFQGVTHFNVNVDDRDEDYLALAVNGSIYIIPFPLQQPRDWEEFKLPDVQFDKDTNFVYFCSAEKTLTLLPENVLKIVPTYNVLMIQDGINQAAFWDGKTSRHLDESSPELETPKGTWMVSSGGRLWVARGKVVLASDQFDPLKFVERTQGEGRGDFYMRKPITGMQNFIGDNRQEVVVVFDDDHCEMLQSGIKDRSTWATTLDFQQVLFPSTGCVAGRSIVFQSGLMWWYSHGGLVSSDSAASTNLTSQVNYKDAEMSFSKQFLANDLSGICGLSFENYLLMGMPIKQNLNSEIFVLDYATVSELSADKIPAWSSSWTGIRPIQFVSANIGGKKRAFAASVDYTSISNGSYNYIWELFQPTREDTFFELDTDFQTVEYFQRIYCEWESRLLGDGMDLKSFVYSNINVMELAGDIDVQVDYRGRRGSYKNILCKKIIAPTNYRNLGIDLTEDQKRNFGTLRKQSRTLTTQNALNNAGCPVCESEFSENIDKCFSLLVRWCGQLAIESVRMFLDPYAESTVGKCEGDEISACLVDEDGVNHSFERSPGFVPEEDLFQNIRNKAWVGVQSFTTTLECDAGSITGPIIIVATATYVSKISQEDADSKALTAATEASQNQAAYYRTVYPCLWEGIEYAQRTCQAALNGAVTGIGVLSDDTVVLSGLFDKDIETSQKYLTKRNEDGTRILNFTQGTGFDDGTYCVLITAGNFAMIGGNFNHYNGSSHPSSVWLNTLGEYDPTLNSSFVTNTDPAQHLVLGLAFDSSGNVILGGFFNLLPGLTPIDSGVIKFAPDGSIVPGFLPDPGFEWTYAVAGGPSDKVYLAGWDTVSADAYVARLNADGTVDGTFTQYAYTKTNKVELRVQADGKIIFCGDGINSGKGIVRLNADGSVDGGFNTNIGTGFNGIVNGAFILSSGKILVVGDFISFNGTLANSVVRLNSDGTIDNSFAIGVGPNDAVNCVNVASDGRIFIGGAFTEIDGDPVYSFAILSQNGTYLPSFEVVTEMGVARTPDGQSAADSLAQQIADNKALTALPCT